MQKIHTQTNRYPVTMPLEFCKVVDPFDECQKGNWHTTSGLVGFGPLLPMDQPIWKSKCRRLHYALIERDERDPLAFVWGLKQLSEFLLNSLFELRTYY